MRMKNTSVSLRRIGIESLGVYKSVYKCAFKTKYCKVNSQNTEDTQTWAYIEFGTFIVPKATSGVLLSRKYNIG